MRAVPAPLSSFVGRTAELELGRELLRRARLVTITGPGGAGKTRLALELMRAGALAFCDLAPAADAEGVRAATALALGLEAEPGGAGEERIARRLEPESGVLVMDNCEQVVDAAAGLAESILVAAPGVRILATSQEPLGLPGESLLRLTALDDLDARRLFIERMREGDLRFRPDAESLRLISEICDRLDGIPLALELAAARARTLPLSELLHGLQDRFALLRSGSRRAPTRQQTLEAAVAWSYGLLSTDERALFDRIAVLPGEFTVEAASKVAEGSVARRDVALLLSRLGERSLLELAGDRHRMPETLRAFGRDRLVEQGRLAETLISAARHLDETGAYRTGLAVTQAALAATGLDDPRRTELLDLAAKQAERAARYDVGMSVLAEMRDRPEVRSDLERLAFVEMRLASAASMATGDPELAGAPAEHALAIYRDLGDTAMSLQAEVEVAWLEGLAGRVDEQWARATDVVARAALAASGTPAHLHALGCAACAAVFTGRFAAGRELLDAGLAIARREHDTYQLGWFTGILAHLLVMVEGPRPALRLLAETRPLVVENLDPVFVEAEAHALLLQGAPAALLQHSRDDETLFVGFGLRGGFCMSARAAAAAQLGQAGQAQRLLASAHRLFAGSDVYYQRRAHVWLEGVATWSLGPAAEAAATIWEGAETVLPRAPAIAAFACRDAADAAWDAGDEQLEQLALARLGELAGRFDTPVYRALLELGTSSGTEALGRLGCLALRARSLEREGRLDEAAAAYQELGLRTREDRVAHRLAESGAAVASPVARRLAGLVVLQGVPPAELEQLAAGSFRLGFEPGEAIFTAGSAADALFVIDAGTVVLDGAVARAEAAAGELLGERSLLPDERHVTTASAGSAAELLRLDRAALLELLSRRPAVGERLVTLVHHRIRQESRLAGETVPPDIPGRVLAGLQDVMAASGEGAPAFEVLPVYIGAEGPMLLRPSAGGTWLVDAAGGRLPAAVIQDALAAAGVPAQIVHSTSWRFEAGRLVLTYLAVMPAPHAASGFHAEGVRRAELARGTATGAPAAIDVAQVVEHGLRHLCWLSRDDPVIREELSPEWLAAVAEYQPEPFRAL